jgi:hypothetical protein
MNPAMKKAITLIALITLFSQLCKAQAGAAGIDTAGTVFYSSEFKWKMQVPAGFVKQNSEQYKANQKEGVELLGKGLNAEITDRVHQICSYKYRTVNYFEANEHPFDKKAYGDFLSSCNKIEDELYTCFKNQVPGSFKIDTLHATTTIGGLLFQSFRLQVSANTKVVATYLFYTRLFDNKEFSIVIVYADKTSGDKMLSAWETSTFEKIDLLLCFAEGW